MESIQEIYETYERFIFRYLYGLTLNFYLAEELTQETFFQVVKSFHKFRGDSHVTGYIKLQEMYTGNIVETVR